MNRSSIDKACLTPLTSSAMKKKRVLILGGGFGGIYTALEFEKRQDPDFEVTLISQDNFFLFTPMLHEVAASDLDLTHIVNPIRKMLRYVHFFEGEVRSVDIMKRRGSGPPRGVCSDRTRSRTWTICYPQIG